MAVTAIWDNGVLLVLGDEGDNYIEIENFGQLRVRSHNQLVPIVNAPEGGIHTEDITGIFAYSFGGEDSIYAHVLSSSFVYVNSGDGDDFILGGVWIDGGAGSDNFQSSNGDHYFFESPDSDDTFYWNNFTGNDWIDEAGGTLVASGREITDDILSIVGGGDGYGYVFSDSFILDNRVVKKGMASVNVDAASGNDTIVVTGEFLDGEIRIEGGSGDDSIVIDSAADTNLFGGPGADYLMGGSGNDYITGGGAEHPDGQYSEMEMIDILAGGDGQDEFILNRNQDGSGFDYIIDFSFEDSISMLNFGGSSPYAFQSGEHVIVIVPEYIQLGFVVLNADAAKVQACIV